MLTLVHQLGDVSRQCAVTKVCYWEGCEVAVHAVFACGFRSVQCWVILSGCNGIGVLVVAGWLKGKVGTT